jgi:molecular chaperone DnaJ
VPVPLTLAALGGSITVPTLAGKAEIELPDGTQHGKTFRLRGKASRVCARATPATCIAT